MKRLVIASFASVTLLASVAVVPVLAQAPPPYRPPVSPYINLGRQQGLNPAINYYGIIRPQLQFSSSVQQLQQQISTNQQGITDLQASALPATGHSAQFMNYQRFFLTSARGQSGQSRGTTTGAVVRPGSATAGRTPVATSSSR